MQIFKAVNKVPGGLMVVPLFLGMAINTFTPNLLKIGGFTEALSGIGFPTILGMYLFTVGTKFTLRAAPAMLKRGFGIMFAKVGIATLLALGVAKFFNADLFGISTLAILVAMSDTNGGMFLALTSVMGNKEDAGTYVPQSIETGPFLTMIILVGAGLADIPWLTIVSVIAPIFVGAILGNIDEDIRDFFGGHEPIIVPFMGFCLGQNIKLTAIIDSGLQGVALGLATLVITGAVCYTVDRLLGGSGIAGAAASSTAGNSAAVPKAIAAADPTYAAIAPAATIQVAASVITTAVLTPILTGLVFKMVQKKRAADAQKAAAIRVVPAE
jgi:2-keto-3-deoxygluconate permease